MKVTAQGLTLVFLVFALIFFGSFLSSCEKQDPAPVGETMTDIDGNVYHTVLIGNKLWTVENLKVTHFTDGTEIPYVENQPIWDNSTTSAYCLYNNDKSNKGIYGCLYNGYAIRSGILVPEGWHVADNCDLMDLVEISLGGLDNAGGKVKTVGTNYWKSPNVGATNESGLSVLPAGWRGDKFYGVGETTSIGIDGYTGEGGPTTFSAYYDNVRSNYGNGSMNTGLSVRCVKDLTVVVHAK